MASGKQTYSGAVATLDRGIRFGTRVRIEGLGIFIVEDRIGHGSEFDVWLSSCSEARQFGRKHRRVYLLQ
jgi:3D (Asp-Asp-Asp) domain-containing protein